MPWFKVDDQLAVHLKTITAGNQAMGLWVRAGSWCMAQLTDGFLPDSMVPALGGNPADSGALVSAGLWHRVDDGWQFHDWAEYQPTREQVIAERERERDKKRQQRAKGAEKSARGVDGRYVSPGDNSGDSRGLSSATQSQSQSHKTTYVNESQSRDNRAREATDSLSAVQQQMATRADLDVERIRGKVLDQLGIHLTLVNALALGNHICSKPRAWPERPTPYVLTSITRNPAEVEKHIHDSGLAVEAS